MTIDRSAPPVAAPLLASAAAVLAVMGPILAFGDVGPHAAQMAIHLFIMSVLAPLLAIVWARHVSRGGWTANALWAAMLAQVVLLWAWHAPALQREAFDSLPLHMAMLLALLASSVVFWSRLADQKPGEWHGLAALLLTGKLVCLLGALLIFATRDLYGAMRIFITICSGSSPTIADQQLAGLLMITVCPLSYVAAGITMAARMLTRLEPASRQEHERLVRS